MIRTPSTALIGGKRFWSKKTTQLSVHGSGVDPILSLFDGGRKGLYLLPKQNTDVGNVIDLSGNNNNATQATSSKKPLLQQNATTGAWFLKFDGFDDYLQTQSIDFSSTDKITVIAAIRKLSDASAQVLTELSQDFTNNAGTFVLAPRQFGKTEGFELRSRGSVYAGSAVRVDGYVAPQSTVLASSCSISQDLVALRVNSILRGTSNIDQGTGNYGNYPIYIGMRGGVSLPFSGELYALLVIDRILTDAETQTVEKEFAKLIGVTL